MSKRLQQIARFTLDFPDEVALSTVAVMAEQVGVPPSALVRFAKALGFDGFSTMQRVFRNQLVARQPSYPERIAIMRSSEQERNGVLPGIVDEAIAALNRLHERISEEDIERAVHLLIEARNVYVVGMRRSFPVAFYLSYALGRFDRPNILVDGIGGLMREQIAGAGRKDLMIAISFDPYTQEVADIVAERAAAGVSVVAITDSMLSPIAQPATLAFEISDLDVRPFRSLVAPMCLAQALAIRLGERLSETVNGTGKQRHSRNA